MCTYVLITEKLAPDRSKGEVLVFRRGREEIKNSPIDEESKSVDRSRNERLEEPSSELVQIQAQTAIFHWKDVCYEIPIKGKKRIILDHVNGWVKPGTLTALMVWL